MIKSFGPEAVKGVGTSWLSIDGLALSLHVPLIEAGFVDGPKVKVPLEIHLRGQTRPAPELGDRTTYLIGL